jgi:tRNA 2-thiouridine synthesizing protein A
LNSPTRRLDTLGKICPLPILLTAKEMKLLAVGDTLEVVGDDPVIADDMPIYCFRAGHKLLELVENDDGTILCRLEKQNPE